MIQLIDHYFSYPSRSHYLLREYHINKAIRWWRHQMEILFASLALCVGEFPSQRPLTRSFDVFFDLCLNKRLRKQSWGWWLYTPSRPLWRHGIGLYLVSLVHVFTHMSIHVLVNVCITYKKSRKNLGIRDGSCAKLSGGKPLELINILLYEVVSGCPILSSWWTAYPRCVTKSDKSHTLSHEYIYCGPRIIIIIVWGYNTAFWICDELE